MQVVNKIEMKKINEIRPYVRNPRKNDKTVEALVKLIPQVGFNVPLVIDKKGIIVKGHSRYFSAIKLGMTELPCVVTDADEEAIKLDRISDNRVSEFSEWLEEQLGHELDTLTLDFDFLEFKTIAPDLPEMDFGEPEGDAVDYEEKKKKFEEWQAKQPAVDIAKPKDIERAIEKQKDEKGEDTKYYKVVCEDCGHTQFVKATDVWDSEKGK